VGDGAVRDGGGTEDAEVLVIGAGLAGLRCAALLLEAGVDVRVIEAGDEIGGRVRSEHVDGFILDVGFQVLNPAYAAVRATVDVAALGLQRMPPGVRVLTDRGRQTLADPARMLLGPTRAPGAIVPTLTGTLSRPAELWALGRWAAPLLTGIHREHGLPRHLLEARADSSLRDSLDRSGAHGLLRSTLERFLAGVVLDDEGETSTAFALLLLRSFVRGTPGVPAGGMEALPAAVAAPLEDRITTGVRVVGVRRDGSGVEVAYGGDAGGTMRAHRVVVATDAWSAEQILGADAIAAPAPKGVVTDWYTVDEPVDDTGLLHVDVRDAAGPVVNTSVISAAAPTYAPVGRHLVQVSSLLDAARGAVPEPETRRHAAQLLGASAEGWELLRRHEIPHALPAQPAPLRVRQSQRIDDVTWVCGDHRDTGSIQGALVSGARAAHGVLASLGHGSPGHGSPSRGQG
jgi:phytoene dehydrogenase-like protein